MSARVPVLPLTSYVCDWASCFPPLNQHPQKAHPGHRVGAAARSLLQSPFYRIVGSGSGTDPGQLRPFTGAPRDPGQSCLPTVMETFLYFKPQFVWTGAYQLNVITVPDPSWI